MDRVPLTEHLNTLLERVSQLAPDRQDLIVQYVLTVLAAADQPPRTGAALDFAQLRLQQERLAFEKQKAKSESAFLSRHLGAVVAFAGVVLTGSQMTIALVQRNWDDAATSNQRVHLEILDPVIAELESNQGRRCVRSHCRYGRKQHPASNRQIGHRLSYLGQTPAQHRRSHHQSRVGAS